MDSILAGRYSLLKPLGSGGFGQTFLAKDAHLPGHPVCVVKQLKLTTSDPKALETAKRLFNLEAETLYRLGSHDQIPRLLAHFEQNNEFYLVQEYVEGVALSEELAQTGRLDEAAVLTLLHDVLHVLAFVHQHGVIHRDIKPANLIRRSRDRKIVLIDFGAVKQLSSQPTDPTARDNFTIAIGSPGYMPIEQQLFQPRFGSDIYAVGMVALHALTGIDPMDLPRDPQTGRFQCALLRHVVPISPGLAAVLDRMVQEDINRRYPNGAEALAALMQLEERQKTGAADAVATVLPLPETHLTDFPRQHSDLTTLDGTLPPTPVQLLPTQAEPAASTGTAPVAPLSRREYRNRQALLNKVKHFWIKGVLETSLHDQVLIALGMEDHPGAIASPWNVSIEQRHQAPTTLKPEMPIISVFDQLGVGRSLLILGEPGSGKTTTLLQLARELLQRAEGDEGALMPVVLNLSSWSAPNGPRAASGAGDAFADWVVEELSLKYQVPKKVGKPWVEQQQLLLLLDGLDEVRTASRAACVNAINQFQQIYGAEVIVCSRSQDYAALSAKLNFQSAIYLRSLTPDQIHHYLDTLTADLTGLRALLERDSALQELARSPLMLNVMVLAYQGITAQEIPQTTTVEERRKQLFDSYIERTLTRRLGPHPYSNDKTIHWLSWLAQQMVKQSQSVFLIERLQPTWLTTASQRLTYRIGAALMAGLGVGYGYGLLSQLSFGLLSLPYRGVAESLLVKLRDGLIVGTVIGLFIGVALALVPAAIKTIETLKWSWRSALQGMLIWAPVGLGVGLIGGAIVELVHRLLFGVEVGAIAQLMSLHDTLIGLIGGMIYGLTSGLAATEIETKIVPNQAIWISATSARWFGLVGGVLGGVAGFCSGLITGLPVSGLVSGLSSGLVIGLIGGGGLSCVKHFTLRLILRRNGCMPWNYARFLNYASDRILLQRVGGGYIFIHRLLLEHFADMQR